MRIRATWLLVFALAGCTSGGGGNENIPPPVSETVGATGGDVKNSDGSGVSIPPGALPGDTMISVTPTPDAPAPATAMPVGTPITFGPEGQQFLKPVTVTISFDPAKLPAGKTAAQLAIFTAPAGTLAYTQLTTSVVDATHLSAQVSHFSTFVAGAPTGCAVTCGAFASGCSSGGTPVGDGGTSTFDAGCPPPSSGCGCSSYCNADGTPAEAPMCSGGTPTGGGGTGTGGGTGGGTGPADGGVNGGGGSCTPGTGNSYSIQCTANGCVCQVNGTAVAMLAAIDCSADPSSFIAQYQACGFPGVYVPPAPPGSGSTGTGTIDAGMTGGGGTPDAGSGGGGPADSGTQLPPDMLGFGMTCSMDIDCAPFGLHCLNMHCQ